jgi:hypothetical protein
MLTAHRTVLNTRCPSGVYVNSPPLTVLKIDITMANRKRTKGQTMIHKTLHRKLDACLEKRQQTPIL